MSITLTKSREARPRAEPIRRRARIAVVTDAILPFHHGGKELVHAELTRRFTRGADVQLFTMRWWGTPRRRSVDGVVQHGICRARPLYVGRRRAIPQALAFAAGCLRLAWHRFDAVHADQMPHLHLFPLWLVCRIRRRRLVVTWFEVWGPDYWRRYLGRAGIVGWWVERAAMRLPDLILPVTTTTAERLRPHLPPHRQMVVVPHGIDLRPIETAPRDPVGCDVIVVGRLIAHKRIAMLIEAIALLRAGNAHITCRIVGVGPELDALRALARSRAVDDLVEFRTDVSSQAELYGLLKAARVFAFPSEREGFGLAVLEALACGLPVVTTSSPDNLAQELVRDSGHGTVCAPTAAAVAAAIAERLARGAATPPRLEEWVAGHDWDAVAARVADLVLSGPVAPVGSPA